MPYELAKKYLAFPLRMAGNTLQITMAEPSDAAAIEELQDELSKELSVCVSTENDIIEAYKKYYDIDEEEARSFFARGEEVEEEMSITQVDDFGAIVAEAADDFEIESGDVDDGFDQFAASDAPIIKLVNGILVKAPLRAHAADANQGPDNAPVRPCRGLRGNAPVPSRFARGSACAVAGLPCRVESARR